MAEKINLNLIRSEIILLHKQNLKIGDIVKKLQHHNIKRLFVYRTIARYNRTGSEIPAKPVGRGRFKRTPETIKAVRERIRRNPVRSGRQLAKDMNMHHKTMQTILKKDKGLIAYKKRLVAGLTDKNKSERVKRCKAILKRHGGQDIIFSDEKLFCLERPLNRQNDRVYGISISNIPMAARSIPRYQNTSAVMVFGAFSQKGKLPLKFNEKGVKINKEYYLKEVLQGHVLPKAKALYGEDPYVFQQDSAPAHKAKLVQAWCKSNFPDFISTEEWPASLPDLNPLDFFGWGYLLKELQHKKIFSLEQFKQVLSQIWDEISQEMVRVSCESFFKRCRLCVKAKGERFEMDE